MKLFARIFTAAVLLLTFLSCERIVLDDTPQSSSGVAIEGERVTINFSIPGFTPQAKALGEGGVLNSLHLAVFGGSGYLKEYVEASFVRTDDYTYQTVDKDDNPITCTVPCYTFSASLAMSDSPRTVHILGNGPSTLPFGYDTAVMPVQLSAEGEMGYWQMIDLPNGIRALRNADGDFIDEHGHVIPEGGTGYVADAKTSAAFEHIALIRNWAKIVLTTAEDSNFTPISLAIVNVPARGALVPYCAATGFIRDYQDLSLTYLDETVNYPANLPSGTSFDTSIPSADAFTAPFGQGVANANGGAVYVYERPSPNDRIPPSFIIVYGHYRNPEDLEHEGDYFYKVDLMETMKVGNEWTSRYYPIYRNFRYQIRLKKILSQGHATPAAAAASAGSADVSADITTGHLSDISDGIGRLHITPWMSKTFTREHGVNDPVNVLHVFFSKTADGEPDLDPGTVRVELLPPEDGGDDIIYNLSLGAPPTSGESKGWRQVSFCTVAPSRILRSQTIRITGTHDTGRLYRDVTITVQPIQPMSVLCSQPRIATVKGAEQVLTINIPDGLGESMFPLEFIIEAEDMTLTPDNRVNDNNLPVISGTSISEHSGYSGKTAFQFVKTVTWEEYLGLERYEDEDEMMWRSFNASFRTNRDVSATTVWVYNDYFEKTSVSFTNFYNKYFQNLGFIESIPEESEQELHLRFEMVEDPGGNYPDDYPAILIQPRGLRLISNVADPGPTPGTYYYYPTGHTVTLTFATTTSDPDDIAVTLTALDYEPGYVEAYRFPFAAFLDGHPLKSGDKWSNSVWSNVAWGYVNTAHNKTVLFGYKDHPDKLNTPVTLTINNGLTTTMVFPNAPTGPRNAAGDINYHEIEFRTIGGLGDIDVTLSSPGYVTAHVTNGRFEGNIRTMRITSSNVFKAGNTYGFTQATPSFIFTEDSGKCQVSFSQIAADPAGSVVLEAGSTSTMTITSQNSNQTLFYVNMIFKVSGNTVLSPETITPSVGTITRYYGSNNQFVWAIPRGNLSASVTLTAPADSDVKLETLYIKAFNGSLYKNGYLVP